MNTQTRINPWALLAGAAVLTLLAACASMGNWPEEGSPSHKTFTATCGTCHNLPHPGRHTADQWDHLLGMMVQIMDKENTPYTREDMRTIRDYLHRNSR